MENKNDDTGRLRLKTGLAEMLKGGVIMDVVNDEQAKIAEDAGATRGDGPRTRAGGHPQGRWGGAHERSGQDRADHAAPVSIPVMAKCRIGHFAEAQVLESLGVDYIDESEVLTPGRRGPPHRQVRFQGAVRLRLPQSGGGPATRRRGRRDDADQGRGRHRQHRRGRAAHARR